MCDPGLLLWKISDLSPANNRCRFSLNTYIRPTFYVLKRCRCLYRPAYYVSEFGIAVSSLQLLSSGGESRVLRADYRDYSDADNAKDVERHVLDTPYQPQNTLVPIVSRKDRTVNNPTENCYFTVTWGIEPDCHQGDPMFAFYLGWCSLWTSEVVKHLPRRSAS